MDWSGQVVVVTGAASGIGRALARRFAAEGARVAFVDLDARGASAAAAEFGAASFETDVSDGVAVSQMLAAVEEQLGPVDLYCSNAGIATYGGPEADDTAWQRSFDVNVMAHVHATRWLVPRWTERGAGRLLVTASAAGLLTQLGSAPYAVTKHAAVAFAEWIAITYGDAGIRVSALCPQGVRTGMTTGVGDDNVIAVDGMLEPDDVADATLAGLDAGDFLILPHPEVGTYFERKATDYDRWLAGMQRLQSRLLGGT